MTPVGKILVFVNLAFSLFVGAMGLMVFTADTGKNVEIAKIVSELKVLKASNLTYQEENKVLLEGKDSEVKRLEKDIDKQKTDLEDKDRIAKDKQKQLDDFSKKLNEKDIILQTAVAESNRRQEQNDQMREILKTEVDRNQKLAKDLEKSKSEEVSQRITALTLKSTNEKLEVQLREMARDMERVKTGGSSAAAQLNKGMKNPPPENVDGLVKVADASGLVKISVGSDVGLAKGHTLELFRLSPLSSQSKYLGTIRILEVSPHEAVAQPVRALTDKPMAGDRVASKILGS